MRQPRGIVAIEIAEANGPTLDALTYGERSLIAERGTVQVTDSVVTLYGESPGGLTPLATGQFVGWQTTVRPFRLLMKSNDWTEGDPLYQVTATPHRRDCGCGGAA